MSKRSSLGGFKKGGNLNTCWNDILRDIPVYLSYNFGAYYKPQYYSANYQFVDVIQFKSYF